RPEPEVDDAFNGAGDRAPVVLRYTALAYPTGTDNSRQWAAKESLDALRAGYYNQFPDAAQNSLDDGEAITAHDAVLTAVKAIRDGLNPRDPTPSPQRVVNNCKGLHDDRSVPGASGLISIDGLTGNPINKPLPILELKANGMVTFVQLSWPNGAPS